MRPGRGMPYASGVAVSQACRGAEPPTERGRENEPFRETLLLRDLKRGRRELLGVFRMSNG